MKLIATSAVVALVVIIGYDRFKSSRA